METVSARLELCSLDAKEVKGLEVDDVEATVHQHLRELGVDDDGVDDERVDAGSDNLVGVVVAVQGDGGDRPVEILWHCHPCCEDHAALPLMLSRGKLRRGSVIDHVTVMDGVESLIVFTSTLVIAFILPIVILLQP